MKGRKQENAGDPCSTWQSRLVPLWVGRTVCHGRLCFQEIFSMTLLPLGLAGNESDSLSFHMP